MYTLDIDSRQILESIAADSLPVDVWEDIRAWTDAELVSALCDE